MKTYLEYITEARTFEYTPTTKLLPIIKRKHPEEDFSFPRGIKWSKQTITLGDVAKLLWHEPKNISSWTSYRSVDMIKDFFAEFYDEDISFINDIYNSKIPSNSKYIKSNSKFVDLLKKYMFWAGTGGLDKTMTIKDIVDRLESGEAIRDIMGVPSYTIDYYASWFASVVAGKNLIDPKVKDTYERMPC